MAAARSLRLTVFFTQSAVLTLAMRLLKEQSTYMVGSETQVWSSGFFHHVVVALLQAEEGESVRAEFMRKFALKYHDVAIYMVTRIAYVLFRSHVLC